MCGGKSGAEAVRKKAGFDPKRPSGQVSKRTFGETVEHFVRLLGARLRKKLKDPKAFVILLNFLLL